MHIQKNGIQLNPDQKLAPISILNRKNGDTYGFQDGPNAMLPRFVVRLLSGGRDLEMRHSGHHEASGGYDDHTHHRKCNDLRELNDFLMITLVIG